MKTLGMILLVIGIAMMLFTGFTMVTKKKVLDVGPLEVNKEERTPIYWSPVTGAVLTGAGILLLVISRQRAGARWFPLLESITSIRDSIVRIYPLNKSATS